MPATLGSRRGRSSPRDRVGQGEGVAAEHVDVLEVQGREPGDVFGPDLVCLGAELVDRRIHVDRVPEHDEVDHEPKRAELVLLAFAVALADSPRSPTTYVGQGFSAT